METNNDSQRAGLLPLHLILGRSEKLRFIDPSMFRIWNFTR